MSAPRLAGNTIRSVILSAAWVSRRIKGAARVRLPAIEIEPKKQLQRSAYSAAGILSSPHLIPTDLFPTLVINRFSPADLLLSRKRRNKSLTQRNMERLRSFGSEL
jgi:hypothetical protein